jgi:hypothetical protein
VAGRRRCGRQDAGQRRLRRHGRPGRRAGLIGYSRGVITILDRPELEAAACECYRLITAEYDRVFG